MTPASDRNETCPTCGSKDAPRVCCPGTHAPDDHDSTCEPCWDPWHAATPAPRDIWQHDETGRIVTLPAGSPSPGKRYFRVRGMGGEVSVVGTGDEARVVFTPAPRDEAPGEVGGDRDALGRRVREVWVAWAKRQPTPKPSWLVPYDELSEADKEADRCIGAALWGDGFRCGLDANQQLSLIAVPAAVRERERAVLRLAVEARRGDGRLMDTLGALWRAVDEYAAMRGKGE